MKNKVANQLFTGILAVTLFVAGPMAPLTNVQAANAKSITVTNEKQLVINAPKATISNKGNRCIERKEAGCD